MQCPETVADKAAIPDGPDARSILPSATEIVCALGPPDPDDGGYVAQERRALRCTTLLSLGERMDIAATGSAAEPLAADAQHTPPARPLLAAVNKPLDWASLMRRVYQIDALACPCGGRLRFVALVTEPERVCEILVALGLDPQPPARAPPRQSDFGWQA